MKKFVLGAVLATAIGAFAQDECVLGEVRPLLEHADSVKKAGKDEITETRKEKGGSYTVMQGGCAHYGVTFAFENGTPRKGEPLLKQAARLMHTVRLKKEHQYIADNLIALLEKNASAPYTAGDTLPNPDHPDINISVEEQQSGTKRVVRVIYSQVL